VEPSGIVVQRATRETIDRLVAATAREGEPESVHERRWRAQENGEASYLVACDGDEPIGWALVRRQPSAQAGDEQLAELEGLDVLPAHQGRGAGRLLLDAALDTAQREGFAGLGLKVTVANPWNDIARAMYARSGFVESAAGEFDDGYWYWTPDGTSHWDGEPHRYLVRRFA
jgi:GNAT superfamily N-acetyltransferase